MLGEEGVLNWLLAPFGLSGPGYSSTGLWLAFTYLWLPFMILPIYAGLERIPLSLLEASADLGGGRCGRSGGSTLPLAFPAVVAGSIFTFSLTLGDYILPGSSRTSSSSARSSTTTAARNLPLAAAFAMVPIAVMTVYLFVRQAARRVREPVSVVESRPTRIAPAARRGRDARVHLLPARRDRDLRVQREHHADVADRGLHDEVVQRRVERRGRPRRALALGQGRVRRDRDRARPRHARRARGLALPLLRARDRSRSSSSCRSRCPGSSPGSRCRRRS